MLKTGENETYQQGSTEQRKPFNNKNTPILMDDQ